MFLRDRVFVGERGKEGKRERESERGDEAANWSETCHIGKVVVGVGERQTRQPDLTGAFPQGLCSGVPLSS